MKIHIILAPDCGGLFPSIKRPSSPCGYDFVGFCIEKYEDILKYCENRESCPRNRVSAISLMSRRAGTYVLRSFYVEKA